MYWPSFQITDEASRIASRFLYKTLPSLSESLRRKRMHNSGPARGSNLWYMYQWILHHLITQN